MGNPDIDEGTGDIDGDGIANFVDADDYDGPAFREDGGMEEDLAEEIPDAAPDGGTDVPADLPEDPSYDPAGDTTYPDTSFDAFTPDSPSDSFDEGVHADAEEGCGCVMAR
ncbi:MAG: hypothetical protein ABIJ56_14030 [Pseudomonadota bacterium]